MKNATATSHGRYLLLEADGSAGNMGAFVLWTGAVGMKSSNYFTNEPGNLLAQRTPSFNIELVRQAADRQHKDVTSTSGGLVCGMPDCPFSSRATSLF